MSRRQAGREVKGGDRKAYIPIRYNIDIEKKGAPNE